MTELSNLKSANYWPNPASQANQFEDTRSGSSYWYPRDFDKYVKSDHYKEQLMERKVPEELVVGAIEEGEFYPTNENGVVGFTETLQGVGVVAICSGKTAKYPTANVLITTWPWIDDTDAAENSDVWNEKWVGKVARQNLDYLKDVGGDIAAPPELKEKMELKERLA